MLFAQLAPVVEGGASSKVLEIAERFGFPVILLAAIGYFMVKVLWPFHARQYEALGSAREIELKAFIEGIEVTRREYLAAVETARREYLATNSANVAVFAELLKTLRDLTEEVAAVRQQRLGH